MSPTRSTSSFSSGEPKDTILSQDPKPDERAPEGSTISVITSAGLPVPNLVGQTESAAEGNAGDDFEIEASGERSSSEPKGTILSQDPEPGERAQQGSTISVVLSAGGIIFQDDFSDTSSGWPQAKDPYGGRGNYDASRGTYRLIAPPGKAHLEGMPKIGNIEDAKVEVDATRTGSAPKARWGVICRRSLSASSQTNHYSLGIGNDGVPQIWRVKDGQPSLISIDASTKVTNPLSTNHIRGDCVGDKLTLYVNDQKLLEVSDNEFASGEVGLYVNSADVSFDNFSVSKP